MTDESSLMILTERQIHFLPSTLLVAMPPYYYLDQLHITAILTTIQSIKLIHSQAGFMSTIGHRSQQGISFIKYGWRDLRRVSVSESQGELFISLFDWSNVGAIMK